MRKRGFTLIELLVVIAIIAILASILFPVFAKAREKARQTQCLNNLRQLAIATSMYAQDNSSRYPGIRWETAIQDYAGSTQLYHCPSDPAPASQISYGYSGLLITADGLGAADAQIVSPTDVGVICDAAPSMAFGSAGLVGGGGLLTTLDSAVAPATRHSKGVIVGFADSHAKYIPCGRFDPKDISNGVSRAFYQAVGLGLINNFAGGIQNTGTTVFTPTGGTLAYGGDAAGSQIVLAAVDIFTAKGSGRGLNRGFKGYDYRGEFGRVKPSSAYAWVGASGINELSVNANGAISATLIGYDAMVVIVNKNCKITAVTDAAYKLTPVQISNMFTAGQTDGALQCYTYPEYSSGATAQSYLSGSRKYFLGKIGGSIGVNATSVDTDQDMVDAVAGDQLGIGYVSASFADTDRVKICQLSITGQGIYNYPNQNVKYANLVPYPRPLASTWGVGATGYYPWMRAIYLYTDAATGKQIVDIINNVDFQSGPLFKTNYWTNEPDAAQ